MSHFPLFSRHLWGVVPVHPNPLFRVVRTFLLFSWRLSGIFVSVTLEIFISSNPFFRTDQKHNEPALELKRQSRAYTSWTDLPRLHGITELILKAAHRGRLNFGTAAPHGSLPPRRPLPKQRAYPTPHSRPPRRYYERFHPRKEKRL